MAHLHTVVDTDKHFVIDAVTRKITTQNEKLMLMQGDHNSEVYTFEIPKVVEGHDMSLCNLVQVHYNDVSADKTESSKDVYLVTDLRVDEDDVDKLVFSWLISSNATKYAGLLGFRVAFCCVDENGVYTYKWNTDIFKSVTVSDGIDNTAVVEEEFSDAFSELEASLEKALADLGKGTSSRISYVTLLSANWEGNESLYSQVVTIDGVTENSQVDLTPSVEQLAIFYNKDLTLTTENRNGVVTVYAIGQKPQNDYTIQVTLTEVLR